MDSQLDMYEDGYKLVKFVTGSENRMRLLTQIYENGEIERDNLKGLMSSSTLTKEKDKLIDHGLVEEDGHTYQITDKGKILVDDLFYVFERGQIAEDNDELVLFLNQMPDWENWIPSLEHLVEAQIYVQEEDYSNPPYSKYVDLLTQSSHICELVHRTIIFSDELDEEFATTDMTGQFIGNPDIAGDSEIDESRFRGWRKKYENGAEYRVLSKRELRFTLSLFDFDDDGVFEGLGIFPSESDEKNVFLYSENEEFIARGEDMFNQLWTEAGGVCPMDPEVVYE